MQWDGQLSLQGQLLGVRDVSAVPGIERGGDDSAADADARRPGLRWALSGTEVMMYHALSLSEGIRTNRDLLSTRARVGDGQQLGTGIGQVHYGRADGRVGMRGGQVDVGDVKACMGASGVSGTTRVGLTVGVH
eukprot:673910-Rhodomonas_salina.2